MPIFIQCPSCSRRLRVPDDLLGQQVKCPTCEVTFKAAEAPAAEATAAPSPSPPPAKEDLSAAIEPEETEVSEERRPRRRRRHFEEEDYEDPYEENWRVGRRQAALTRLKAPAIAMLVAAALGILVDLFQVVYALAAPPPPQPVGNQPAWLVEMQKGAHGPLAAAMGGIFAIVSLVILIGAIMMLSGRAYGFGIAASILSMINFVNCCCLLGLPFGIWALVVMTQADVKDAFG